MEVNLAGVMTLALLAAFSGVVVVELGREHPKPCGCMGSSPAVAADPYAIRSSLRRDLARNVSMMIGAAWLYLSAHGRKRPAEFSSFGTSLPMPLSGAGIADQTDCVRGMS